MLLQDLNLRVENKLLSDDLSHLPVQVLDVVVVVTAHLGVLVFQQLDVLVGSLVVVVQAANARLLFILKDFLLEYFQLKLHKVDLLVQIGDVLILRRLVRILPQHRVIPYVLVLPAEVHVHRRLVIVARTIRLA